MSAEPVDIPVTAPAVPETTDTRLLAELQAPPPAAVNDIAEPIQTVEGPVTAPGEGLTVIVVVVEQPPDEKVIMEVPPAVATPVTFPEPSTVAIDVEPLVHVPVPSVNAVTAPGQTFVTPVIAAGVGITVTVAVVEHPVTGKA